MTPAIVATHLVAPGTRLRCDGGFTCMKENSVKVVQQDEKGLWVKCSAGQHYLDGQENEERNYVGFWLLEPGP